MIIKQFVLEKDLITKYKLKITPEGKVTITIPLKYTEKEMKLINTFFKKIVESILTLQEPFRFSVKQSVVEKVCLSNTALGELTMSKKKLLVTLAH